MSADLLIRNGRVFTADPRQPWAQAVAMRGREIAWVGADDAAAAWRGPNTIEIDAQHATVMPGFIDCHFHLLQGSLKLAGLQLDAVTNLDELGAAVIRHAAAHPDEEWIVGYQFAYAAIPPGTQLDRRTLDRWVADRPLLIVAYDEHTVWANTTALQRANLLQGAVTLPGSEIVMASDGTATGELREPAAFKPVRDLVPAPDAAAQRRLLRKGLARCAALGITGVHNMDGSAEQIALYASLEEADEMTLRVYVPYDVTPATKLTDLREAVAWREHYRGSHVCAGAVKLFMDGVLESYTALLVEPYADRPDDRGSALYTAEHFNRIAVEADRLGLQIFVHCCGDGAVRRTLDGYALAQATNGRRDSRHRVEHIELITAQDLARFAELGVLASMQPWHAPLDRDTPDVWPQRAGRARWPLSFAWETLRQAGATLVYGSDWPVVSMNPLLGIYAARNRQPWADGDPVQRQPLDDLLLGYTRRAAYAQFQEQVKGMLRPGMLADVVVLDADLFATPDAHLAQVKPVATICDGRIVFGAGD